MSGFELVLYLVSNLLIYYTYCRLYRVMLGSARVPIAIEYGAYFLAFLINSALSPMGEQEPIINLITSLGGLVAASFLYRRPFRARLLACSFSYVLIMLIDMIGYCIGLFSPAWINQKSILLFYAALLFFLAQQVIERLWGTLAGQSLSWGQWLAVFFFPLSSIVVIQIAMRSGYTPESIILISLLQLATNVLIFQLYNVLSRQYRGEYEKRMLEQQNKAFASQFEIIQKNMEGRRTLDHDMRNHLATLGALLEREAYSEADRYLSNLTQRFHSNSLQVSTGHLELDCILNFKLERTQELGTKVKINAKLPNDKLVWDLFDLNVIMGNLLDNALEALERCEKRKLSVEMWLDRGNLFIEVGNSYDGNVQVVKSAGPQRFLSRKKDTAKHGLGLKSVQAVVDKYQGSMRIRPLETMFFVSIILPEQ